MQGQYHVTSPGASPSPLHRSGAGDLSVDERSDADPSPQWLLVWAPLSAWVYWLEVIDTGGGGGGGGDDGRGGGGGGGSAVMAVLK